MDNGITEGTIWLYLLPPLPMPSLSGADHLRGLERFQIAPQAQLPKIDATTDEMQSEVDKLLEGLNG